MLTKYINDTDYASYSYAFYLNANDDKVTYQDTKCIYHIENKCDIYVCKWCFYDVLL